MGSGRARSAQQSTGHVCAARTLPASQWRSAVRVRRRYVTGTLVRHLKGALVASMSAEIGAIVPGTVVRIAPYGAFIKLESGETGLVHISEIDRNYVRSVEEHLRIDDAVTVKVVGVKEDGKIDLSIKQAASDWQPEVSRPRRAAKDPEFEQKLKRFMRSSEERLVDVKRQREGRRG
jgi:predicted RNA-binding protein with RPS1 domain